MPAGASRLVEEFAGLRKSERAEMQRIAKAMEDVIERNGQFWIKPGESLDDALRRYESEAD